MADHNADNVSGLDIRSGDCLFLCVHFDAYSIMVAVQNANRRTKDLEWLLYTIVENIKNVFQIFSYLFLLFARGGIEHVYVNQASGF